MFDQAKEVKMHMAPSHTLLLLVFIAFYPIGAIVSLVLGFLRRGGEKTFFANVIFTVLQILLAVYVGFAVQGLRSQESMQQQDAANGTIGLIVVLLLLGAFLSGFAAFWQRRKSS
jgi:hypothetical protein